MPGYDTSILNTVLHGRIALRQQAMAIGAQRAMAADRFAYESAFAAQEQEARERQQSAAYQHDDELFERQFAGRIAEQQLAHAQARQMAEFQARTMEERDFRLADLDSQRTAQQADIELERMGRQQRFQEDMARFEAGNQEARDYRLADIQEADDYRRARIQETGDFRQAGIQEARDYRLADIESEQTNQKQVFAAGMAAYEADVRRGEEIQKAKLQAIQSKMAFQKFEAEQEILKRRQDGTLASEYQYKADQIAQEYRLKQDQQIVQGLADGSLVLDPEVQAEVAKQRSAILAYERSNAMSPEQKEEAERQSYERILSLHRKFARSPTAAERGGAWVVQKQKIMADWSPEQREQYGPFLVSDGKGGVMFARGTPKSAFETHGPLSVDELRQHLGENFDQFKGLPWVRGKDGKPEVDKGVIEWMRDQRADRLAAEKSEEKRRIGEERTEEKRQAASVKLQEQRRRAVAKVYADAAKAGKDEIGDFDETKYQEAVERGMQSLHLDLTDEEVGDLEKELEYAKRNPDYAVGRERSLADAQKAVDGFRKAYPKTQVAPAKSRVRSPSGAFEWDGQRWIPVGG